MAKSISAKINRARNIPAIQQELLDLYRDGNEE